MGISIACRTIGRGEIKATKWLEGIPSALSRRIAIYSHQSVVKLSFLEKGIRFEPAKELIGDSRWISEAFQKVGISSLTFQPRLNEEKRREIEELLNFASIGELPKKEKILKMSFVRSYQGISLAQTSAPKETDLNPGTILSKIPGEFKHYTTLEYLEEILRRGILMPHAVIEGRQSKLYLTPQSYSPEKVWEILFIGNPFYKFNGEAVIGLKLAPWIKARIKKVNEIEYYLEEPLILGKDAEITYAGANPLGLVGATPY